MFTDPSWPVEMSNAILTYVALEDLARLQIVGKKSQAAVKAFVDMLWKVGIANLQPEEKACTHPHALSDRDIIWYAMHAFHRALTAQTALSADAAVAVKEQVQLNLKERQLLAMHFIGLTVLRKNFAIRQVIDLCTAIHASYYSLVGCAVAVCDESPPALATLKALLRKGADHLLFVTNTLDSIPFNAAIRAGKLKVVQLFIDEHKVDWDALNKFWYSPLDMSVQHIDSVFYRIVVPRHAATFNCLVDSPAQPGVVYKGYVLALNQAEQVNVHTLLPYPERIAQLKANLPVSVPMDLS